MNAPNTQVFTPIISLPETFLMVTNEPTEQGFLVVLATEVNDINLNELGIWFEIALHVTWGERKFFGTRMEAQRMANQMATTLELPVIEVRDYV